MKIIANKKLDITESEYELYKKICDSYDSKKISGKDLFVGLFESNEHGIITFVYPAGSRTTMEAYCFMLSLMVNQHLRIMHEINDSLVRETRAKVQEIVGKVEDGKSDNRRVNPRRGCVSEVLQKDSD